MKAYTAKELMDLPTAERNAITALQRAGIDTTDIESIEHCSLDYEYNITVQTKQGKRIYKIARDFSTYVMEHVYEKCKQKSNTYKSAAYRRAEAFFSI